MTSWPYSRSCRTASIRSGRAGGLAGELEETLTGDFRLMRNAVLSRHLFVAWRGGPFPTKGLMVLAPRQLMTTTRAAPNFSFKRRYGHAAEGTCAPYSDVPRLAKFSRSTCGTWR
jgi:hypothetical protein